MNFPKTITVHLIFILYILCSLPSAAQENTPSLSQPPKKHGSFKERLAFGGNLGFQFGTITGITLSPEASIRTVDHLHVGLRFLYQYYRYKNYFWDDHANQYLSYESSVYGGGIYLRYYLYSLFPGSFAGNLFGHVEYEYQYYTRPYQFSPTGYIYDPYGNPYIPGKEGVEVHSFFVGGGYHQPVGNKVFMDFLLLFNLNESYDSPYSNPIFRLGVGVGL